MSSYCQRRRRLIAYGRWQPWVDAAPVRDHVRAQMAAGLGWMRIAELANVSDNTVSRLLYSKSGNPPTNRLRTDNAIRLLAVKADMDNLSPYASIDATGTHRRVQALMWLGYSEQRIGERADGLVIRDVLKRDRVIVRTALAVRAVCKQLWDQPPGFATTSDRISVSKARAKARRLGYVPFAAWDNIDDPTAVPDLGSVERGPVRVDLAEVLHLSGGGVSTVEIARRLGVKVDSIRNAQRKVAS